MSDIVCMKIIFKINFFYTMPHSSNSVTDNDNLVHVNFTKKLHAVFVVYKSNFTAIISFARLLNLCRWNL